jgi:hypothetical protein
MVSGVQCHERNDVVRHTHSPLVAVRRLAISEAAVGSVVDVQLKMATDNFGRRWKRVGKVVLGVVLWNILKELSIRASFVTEGCADNAEEAHIWGIASRLGFFSSCRVGSSLSPLPRGNKAGSKRSKEAQHEVHLPRTSLISQRPSL